MDDPSVVIHRDSAESAARKTRALVSGETLSIGGESFLVTADTIHLAQLLIALMGGFPIGKSPVTAAFALVEGAPPCPPGPADDCHENIEVWQDGPGLWLRHPSGAVGRASPDGVIIGGVGDDLEPLRRLFLPLIAHVLGHRGVFALHAGAIDAGDGALLILGSSGSGKSTLVGISLGKRWQALGDDVVALTPSGGGGVAITGIARPPAVPVGALQSRLHDGTPRDPRGRVHLDPALLDTRPHELIGTVLPYRSASREDDIEKVKATDLLHEVVSSFPGAASPGLLARFMPTAGRIARMDAYRLPIAGDGAARFSDAGLRLEDVARRIRDGRR